MTSDESEDEPLSVLAAAKKENPEAFPSDIYTESNAEKRKSKKKKKKKQLPLKKLGVTIKLKKKFEQQVITRPSDVWLYVKDLNPTGPYSCLLCSEWFLNRAKVIVHYLLNHKKDFCGICRYFVPDREAWFAHQSFHVPWPCSQCIESFTTEAEMRQHLSANHNLVHCRLCHFRVPDDKQYDTHLLEKHNVVNASSKNAEEFWEVDFDGSMKFLCLLCSKSNISSTFFNHYMGYHHLTIKCLSAIMSGKDHTFTVHGANISTEFIENQLREHANFGYIDVEHPKVDTTIENEQDTAALLKVLVPEIKQELTSDTETDEVKADKKNNPESVDDELERTYTGEEDYDCTLTEVIVLQKCYFDYATYVNTTIQSESIPIYADIDYKIAKETKTTLTCWFCKNDHVTCQTFSTHMCKVHGMKSMSLFSCRVCATPFDTENELKQHIKQELGDFDDLWICQFCDKEFDNRAATRQHLVEHWDILEYDNCFSPHLGFKCKYCPILFWNETDREIHQVKTHFGINIDQFYKCEICFEVFSDKVWFTYHFIEKHMEDKSIFNQSLIKCCVCSLVVRTVEDMRAHFFAEHPEARKVYCSLDPCSYRPLGSRKSFKWHLRSTHRSSKTDGRPVNCAICAREFASSRSCSAHMAQVHGPGKFKCKLCKDIMHTMDERKLHYMLRHPGRHPFECKECGKSFQYKSSLYMHKQEHLPTKTSFVCSYCKKEFAKKDSFREHVQIHEGPRHACSYCPMRFVQRSNMLRHERRHTGERPYSCHLCPRTFADKGACSSHIRTHTKTLPFSCAYCDATFVQKSKLTYHTRKHTGENLETCTVCSKLFTSGCALREHMKIHERTPQEATKCPLCGRIYQDERSMLRHLRTAHTAARLFPCPLCSKALTSVSGLRHHVTTHSKCKVFRCTLCSKACSVRRTMMKHLRKRHSLSGSHDNIKKYYSRLDPRDCELGLDEETINRIFGPRKVENSAVIANFVNMNVLNEEESDKSSHEKKASQKEKESGGEDGEQDEQDEKSGKYEVPVKVKMEMDSDGETTELEPTDFVSVKIEPIEGTYDS